MENQNTPMDSTIIQCTELLIASGTSFNIESLDSIYAETLRIVRLDEDGKVMVLDKPGNMAFFAQKKASGAEPLSRKTVFHYAERQGDTGYVFVTRVMKLNDRWEELKYHIEWHYRKGHWQVVHENVYAQPVDINKITP